LLLVLKIEPGEFLRPWVHREKYSWPEGRTFWTALVQGMGRGSSGSIVSDYGLDDRAIGVRSPAGAKDFSSILSVQTGSGDHPASCTMGAGGPFPGDKARPGMTLTTHPHLVPTSRMNRSYASSPTFATTGV
jgi:hypothetical protein